MWREKRSGPSPPSAASLPAKNTAAMCCCKRPSSATVLAGNPSGTPGSCPSTSSRTTIPLLWSEKSTTRPRRSWRGARRQKVLPRRQNYGSCVITAPSVRSSVADYPKEIGTVLCRCGHSSRKRADGRNSKFGKVSHFRMVYLMVLIFPVVDSFRVYSITVFGYRKVR